MRKSVSLVILFFSVAISAQNDDRWMDIDEFRQISNDSLLAHVDHFHEVLDQRQDAVGLVVLYGSRINQHLNQRRIEGCSRWRKRPANRFRFVFGPDEHPTNIQGKFYLVAKDVNVQIESPDYKLIGLSKPIELSSSLATDEYCPRNFTLDWYARFMTANPSLRGKVIIDASKSVFNKRIGAYRINLKKLGVDPRRIKFLRRHFIHERDEQWWLVPSK